MTLHTSEGFSSMNFMASPDLFEGKPVGHEKLRLYQYCRKTTR